MDRSDRIYISWFMWILDAKQFEEYFTKVFRKRCNEESLTELVSAPLAFINLPNLTKCLYFLSSLTKNVCRDPSLAISR